MDYFRQYDMVLITRTVNSNFQQVQISQISPRLRTGAELIGSIFVTIAVEAVVMWYAGLSRAIP